MSDLSLNTCVPRRRRASWMDHLMNWTSIARQRRALAQLDADQLCDIGITRAEAKAEAERPVWDVPSHWTR